MTTGTEAMNSVTGSGTPPPPPPPAANGTPPPPAAVPPAAGAFTWPTEHADLGAKYGNDPVKAIGALAAAQTFLGADPNSLVRLPKDGDAEGMKAVYTRLGMPPTPDAYKLDPEVAKVQAIKDFLPAVHAAGLNNAQVNALAKTIIENGAAATKAADDAFMAQAGKDMETLKAEWGAAYDQQLRQAKATAMKLGITGEQADAIERAIGTKAMLEMYAKAGAELVEKPHVDAGGTPTGQLTPAQATARRSELARDRGFQARIAAKDVGALLEYRQLNAWSKGMTLAEFEGAIAAGEGLSKR